MAPHSWFGTNDLEGFSLHLQDKSDFYPEDGSSMSVRVTTPRRRTTMRCIYVAEIKGIHIFVSENRYSVFCRDGNHAQCTLT